MITEIGIVAGEIWQYLEKYNETTLEKLIETTGRDRDLLIMGLGWLAREGHIILSKKDKDYKIVLRKKD
ncbi:MAG: winged helix-turn-helix domain-containing protein [Candidatus Omnitrophica bacterium]|nr:winged helix-turn-helix domain-containing protein [Candidatus Omnitrophota bacterium]MCM8803207.1 winged helix-turn-helix domain-containing protein [Candidatus Omnitrophota bacterium]